MIHFLIWILVIILYSQVFWQLYQTRWEKIDYTHAYFILPLSLWIAWRNRLKIKDLTKHKTSGKNLFSLLILCFGILMFIFGWKQDYIFISTLSLIPLLFGLTSYLYGKDI